LGTRFIQRHSPTSTHVIQPLLNCSFVFITLPLQSSHRLLMYGLIDENIDFVRSRIDERQRITALVQRVRLFSCAFCFDLCIISHERGVRQAEDSIPGASSQQFPSDRIP
jgi:hypothetical protein